MTDSSSFFLNCQNLHLHYGAQTVLCDLNLHLAQTDIACLLGDSGCGKTTLLRAIAGFEPLISGQITLDQRILNNADTHCPPDQRNVGLFFQDYALFPHLSVRENIGFGLHQCSAVERHSRVDELLNLVDLTALANHYPHALSGGQQQRVALARALANRPRLLLLDEPFSNLDLNLREQLVGEVRAILKQEQMTALIVTHDQQEAFALADKIGILQQGCITQWGTPYDIYHKPTNRYVAGFIGQSALLPATISAPYCVQLEIGEYCSATALDYPIGAHIDVLLRPDDVIHDHSSALTARVIDKAFRGENFLYTLALASGRQILAHVPSHHDHQPGQDIGIRLELDHLIAFSQQ